MNDDADGPELLLAVATGSNDVCPTAGIVGVTEATLIIGFIAVVPCWVGKGCKKRSNVVSFALIPTEELCCRSEVGKIAEVG